MDSHLVSRRDLDFLLYEWLEVESLVKRERFAAHDRDTFDAALELAERIATERFAPHNKTADANEPTFDGERVHLIPEVKQAVDAYARTMQRAMYLYRGYWHWRVLYRHERGTYVLPVGYPKVRPQLLRER